MKSYISPGESLLADNSHSTCWKHFLAGEYGLKEVEKPRTPTNNRFKLGHFSPATIAEVHIRDQILSPITNASRSDSVMFKLVLSGKVTFRKLHKITSYETGSLCIIDGAENFIESFDDETNILVVHSKKKDCANLLKIMQASRNINFLPKVEDFELVKNMSLLALSQSPNTSPQLGIQMGKSILSMLTEIVAIEKKANPGRERVSLLTMERVKGVIEANIGDETLNAQHIAHSVGLSVNYLNRLFKNANTSLMRYVWQQRVLLAERMLNDASNNNITLGEIAWQCGFSSQSHFCHLYKKYFDRSPGQIRKNAE